MRRRAVLPRWANPLWLLVAAVVAGNLARPLWDLWHPLGSVAAVAFFLVGFVTLVRCPRRRRVAAIAVAEVVVRSRP